jgi:hypothetical protein
VDPGHLVGAGLATALAALGGVGLWIIALAGLPGTVPVQYQAAAWLIPFAAGPAALCAGWGTLALWRAGRRAAASLASLVAGTSLLAGLFAATAHDVRLVVLLSLIAPLLVAYVADVAMVRWAMGLRRRAWMLLPALAPLPLAAGLLGWPGPLLGVAALSPVLLATPLLAAAFLTGARSDGRPRGAPLPALAFFGLPVAVLGGLGLAAGVSALGSVLSLAFLPLFFLLRFSGAMALAPLVVLVMLVGMLLPSAAPPARAPRRQNRRPEEPPTLPSLPAPTTAAVEPTGGRRRRAIELLTDRFLSGDLTNADYEALLDHLFQQRKRPLVPAELPRTQEGIDAA